VWAGAEKTSERQSRGHKKTSKGNTTDKYADEYTYTHALVNFMLDEQLFLIRLLLTDNTHILLISFFDLLGAMACARSTPVGMPVRVPVAAIFLKARDGC
jgi:hypothetical protein